MASKTQKKAAQPVPHPQVAKVKATDDAAQGSSNDDIKQAAELSTEALEYSVSALDTF